MTSYALLSEIFTGEEQKYKTRTFKLFDVCYHILRTIIICKAYESENEQFRALSNIVIVQKLLTLGNGLNVVTIKCNVKKVSAECSLAV